MYEARFMQMAIDLSRKALETPGTEPFGAVVVRAGVVVGEGLNHSLANFDPTSAAEADGFLTRTPDGVAMTRPGLLQVERGCSLSNLFVVFRCTALTTMQDCFGSIQNIAQARGHDRITRR